MTEIFYYSGTGFTLKAAKIMQAELEEDVILTPIIGAMKNGVKESRAEKVGLLMPMHAFGLPKAYIKFLKGFRFPKARYIFSLVTRGGAPTRMHKEINKYLKRQNKTLNAFRYATAPNTFDIIFHVHATEELTEERSNFDNAVKAFAGIVNDNINLINPGYRNRFLEYFLFPILKMLNRWTGYFHLQNDFYADDKCTGCGRCEKMCLSGKIRMAGDKPEWQRGISCQFCLACLQLCPEQAVQVRKTKTPELDRIFCPDIDYREIAAQKKMES